MNQKKTTTKKLTKKNSSRNVEVDNSPKKLETWRSQQSAFKTYLESFFKKWNHGKGTRGGIHASDILKSDEQFCYREMILSRFFKKNVTEHHSTTLQYFLNGWVLHEKWQGLFEQFGKVKAIEKSVKNTDYFEIFFTPDAILEIFGKDYIVEIKGYNANGCSKLDPEKPPADALNQANLYMALTKIPRALLLVENKDNQQFMVWVIDYDYKKAQKFIKRLNYISKMVVIYEEKGEIPKKINACGHYHTSRAASCPMREVCFASKKEMEKYKLGAVKPGADKPN